MTASAGTKGRSTPLRIPGLCAAAIVFALAAAVVLVVGVTVAVGFAAGARDWLGFTFPGVPATFGEALAIFANNARMAIAAAVALTVAQIGHAVAASDASGQASKPPAVRGALVLFDVGLAVATLSNLLLPAAGLGAYGERMVWALLPHAPVELAAFALALGLYIDARRRRRAPREWIAGWIVVLALLAAAAGLETFAQVS